MKLNKTKRKRVAIPPLFRTFCTGLWYQKYVIYFKSYS